MGSNQKNESGRCAQASVDTRAEKEELERRPTEATSSAARCGHEHRTREYEPIRGREHDPQRVSFSKATQQHHTKRHRRPPLRLGRQEIGQHDYEHSGNKKFELIFSTT